MNILPSNGRVKEKGGGGRVSEPHELATLLLLQRWGKADNAEATCRSGLRGFYVLRRDDPSFPQSAGAHRCTCSCLQVPSGASRSLQVTRMPPLRQPSTMVQLAERQLVDMATAAAEGLVTTPGDPNHIAVMRQLQVGTGVNATTAPPKTHADFRPAKKGVSPNLSPGRYSLHGGGIGRTSRHEPGNRVVAPEKRAPSRQRRRITYTSKPLRYGVFDRDSRAFFFGILMGKLYYFGENVAQFLSP